MEKLKSHEAQPSVISIFSCALENFPCALKAKSQITPLCRVMFAINTTITSRRVCFNPKRTEKPCALGFSMRFGLKHTLRCDLGKIMKIRSIDFSGEWCYFQNQAFNMVLRNVKLILSHITSHFYRKCKNIWQRLSDRHNLFSLFFLMK